MATAVTIHDEGTSGGRIRSFKLHLAAERITVRELIERRITQEVEEYNRASRSTSRVSCSRRTPSGC